ncbi:TetR/AcrR family transcriptional regulator [Azospirillum rugosum]|uniref:AcrR family transcriptional regulator n=1 Tax=Azospirillum rugosum TaxID=416170 RepID=A0ABS4SPG4_9PROT|nr:TetR/AcrR family transcriptional regulator [Azospirillum rugosum]MBP2294450.1 AcrR family transcriptional regulator [Azospirillum rugosum]MDQ0528955.1 AcrR family transcriptional regulator [Azospirillum rugosum]
MPDAAPPSATRRSRRKEARPAEVIEAARDLFMSRGYAATKLEDVARKAGVSVGLPYLYFENKEGLFKAVVRESILPQFRMGEEMLDSFTGSSEEFLRFLAHKFWEMEQSPNAGLSKLVIAEAGNFPDIARFYMEEVVLRGRRFFARILHRGIDRGEFRPMDVEQMARVAAAPLTMLSLWNRSLRPYEPDPAHAAGEPYIDAYLDLILHGLRAAPKDAQRHD